MFDFEDFGEVIKLLGSWLILSSAMPAYLTQMMRTPDGWVYLVVCFLVSVMFRPVANQLVR